MAHYNFTVRIEYEDGWYSVQCAELPGAVSQGKTLDEAIANIKEATEGYHQLYCDDDKSRPVCMCNLHLRRPSSPNFG